MGLIPRLSRLAELLDSSKIRFAGGFAGGAGGDAIGQVGGAGAPPPSQPPPPTITNSRVYTPESPRDPGLSRPFNATGAATPPGLAAALQNPLPYLGNPGMNLEPFDGVSPWATATGRQFTDASGSDSYPVLMGSPEQPNVNYTTPQAAAQIQGFTNALGTPSTLTSLEGTGPDPIDAPQHLLNYGDQASAVPAGQIAWMIMRGDTPEQIKRYLTNSWG